MRPAQVGQPWAGEKSLNPFWMFGKFTRADGHWAGWLHAVDADTGVWKWRLKSNYPIVGGLTPTAGGVVFFGDMGGNFYALDAANGQKLWGQKIGGAIGGGVITYTANGAQKVAVAAGYFPPLCRSKSGERRSYPGSRGRLKRPTPAPTSRDAPRRASYFRALRFREGEDSGAAPDSSYL